MALRQFGAAAAVAVTLALAASPAHAVTEIQWWHAMTGGNNDVVNKLAEEFNASQSDYKVVPTFKGSYPDTMNAGIAAFRAGNAPHIIQVFEVGTATMMSATGAIKPVYQLMKDAGEPFDPKAYLPTITGYYSTSKGDMLSFPFNSSSMVMWINKDELKKAGVAEIPKTWPEVFEAAKKLKAAGHDDLRLLQRLGILGAYRAVFRLAQRADRHQGQRPRRFRHRAEVQLAAACQASAEPDRPAEGQDLRLFRPRQQERGPLLIRRMRDLPDLVGLLRHRQGHRQVRLHLGADALLSRRRRRTAELDHRRRLAVGDGRQEAGRIQGRRKVLHLPVGHQPPGQAAPGVRLSADHQGGLREDRCKDGFYEKNPILQTPLKELTNKEPTENSRGLRFGNMVQMRDVWAEEIEAALAGKKTAKEALDAAVARGNAMLRTFEKTAK